MKRVFEIEFPDGATDDAFVLVETDGRVVASRAIAWWLGEPNWFVTELDLDAIKREARLEALRKAIIAMEAHEEGDCRLACGIEVVERLSAAAEEVEKKS
jgi:hypothetical protein